MWSILAHLCEFYWLNVISIWWTAVMLSSVVAIVTFLHCSCIVSLCFFLVKTSHFSENQKVTHSNRVMNNFRNGGVIQSFYPLRSLQDYTSQHALYDQGEDLSVAGWICTQPPSRATCFLDLQGSLWCRGEAHWHRNMNCCLLRLFNTQSVHRDPFVSGSFYKIY